MIKVKSHSKSAFTLVELSIVLLVLAVLVAGLLVGKKIVDRATGRRLAQEADYYKKAVTMFYDAYSVLPGNLTTSICQKFNEFNYAPGGAALTICSGWVSSTPSATYDYINSTDYITRSYTMGWLKVAGLVDTVSLTPNGGNLWTSSASSTRQISQTANDDFYSTAGLYAQSEVSNNVYVTALGMDLTTSPINNPLSYYRGVGNYYAGSTNSYNEFSGSSISNKPELYAWNGKNAVLFAYNVEPAGTSGINYSGARGAVSAAVALDIDLKYDDGKPYSGTIVGLKPGAVRGVSTGTSTNSYCTTSNSIFGTATDPAFNGASGFTYITDVALASSKTYGCNMLFQIESSSSS